MPIQVAVDDIGAADIATDLRKDLELADRDEAIGLHLVGQTALWAGLQDVSKEGLATAEGTGFPIVLLILLAVFGSLAAAFLPLALGLVSVLATGGLIYLLSGVMEMSVFVTNMASMVGIGVAVDYSLFVLARYREEVRAGRGPDEARGVALATSGVAVLFSGATVIVSLAGLYMVDTTAIRSMALGAILVVAVSMLGAATLLPVLIKTLGHRAYARGRIFSVIQLAVRSRSPRRAARPLRARRRRSPSGSAGPRRHAPPRARARRVGRPCCSSSASRRCRCRPATARCASSRTATRRASASRPRRRSRAPATSRRCG